MSLGYLSRSDSMVSSECYADFDPCSPCRTVINSEILLRPWLIAHNNVWDKMRKTTVDYYLMIEDVAFILLHAIFASAIDTTGLNWALCRSKRFSWSQTIVQNVFTQTSGEWTIMKKDFFVNWHSQRSWKSNSCVCVSRNSSSSSCTGIDNHFHGKDMFFCFSITEQVSCHQRFISLIRNRAGSQVLGVGDNKKECFVWRNPSQLPAANFQTMLICQRDAFGKHLSFCWRILGSLSVARVGQYSFCLTFSVSSSPR